MRKSQFIFAICILGFIATARADTIYLKNGRNIEGIIKNDSGDEVELEISIGSVKFNKSQISKIEKSAAGDDAAMRLKWDKEKADAEARREQIKEEEAKKPKKVEFEKKKQSIIVDCTLDNRVQAKLVLDTGASTVMLRKGVADRLMRVNTGLFIPDMQLRLADGRVVNGKSVIIRRIKVQDAEATNVSGCILLDDVGGADMYDGLLGMSFLNRFKFTVDQKENKLILEKQ
jgi:clan AA aspartic protease (TIGR02281 family)